MKRFLTLAFVLLSAVPLAAADDGPVLARDGKSDYVIVVPDKPTAVETTAAKELQSHLEQVTGAKLEILPEGKVPAERKQIVVGACKRLAQLVPDVKLDQLGYDGIVIKTVGRQPGAGRPSASAARSTPSTRSSKTRSAAAGGPRPRASSRRSRRWRSASSTWSTPRRSAFARRSTATPSTASSPRGRSATATAPGFRPSTAGTSGSPCSSTRSSRLLPPDKYFDEHPEWYSEIDGKRTHEHAQLCLTNDEMRKELARNALAVLRNDPEAGVISISQNDWHGRCQCAKCKAVEEEEGSPVGPAPAVRQRGGRGHREGVPQRPGRDARLPVHADAAQAGQAAAERGRPALLDRVLVRPAAWPGPQNEKFRNDIEGWSKIAPQLYIWDYVTNFSNYILPHPNLRVLAPNLRFFVDHNVIGDVRAGRRGLRGRRFRPAARVAAGRTCCGTPAATRRP